MYSTELPDLYFVEATITSLLVSVHWQNVVHDSTYDAGTILFHELTYNDATSTPTTMEISPILGINQYNLTGLTPSTQYSVQSRLGYNTTQGTFNGTGQLSDFTTSSCNGEFYTNS